MERVAVRLSVVPESPAVPGLEVADAIVEELFLVEAAAELFLQRPQLALTG